MKGSITVKRTHLLAAIENMKMMFRNPNISDDARRVIWGQQISFERILEEDDLVLVDNYNEFMQEHLGMLTRSPADTFVWLFDPNKIDFWGDVIPVEDWCV